MNSWHKTTIENVCKFVGGSQPPKSEFSYVKKEGYIRLVQTRDFKTDAFEVFIPKHSTNKFFDKSDIMIGRYGPPIFQIFRGLEGAYNVALLKAVPKSNITKDYLYYYLLQDTIFQYVDKLSPRTGGQTGVDLVALNKYPIYLPGLAEQKKIAVMLSSLDEKIELNRKINAELEQMARTLYDYWFVQFDFPDANGKPYKSSGGQMVFSDQLKCEIPAGWKVQDMYNDDLFDIIKPKIDKFAGEKQYIATADVDSLNISKGSPITYENRESRANMQPKEYTVWFAKMKASIKHILVGDYSKDLLHQAIFSTGFMGMQTRKEAFEYLAFTVHRPYFELVKDANSNGATMAAIGNNDMKNIKLLVPSPDVITGFHEAVRPILQKIDQNRQQSQKLAELRDWLLPMLMNGQVKVL